MTAMLELRRVSKSYGEDATLVHALIGADLTGQVGELMAVMGPSGSGKSTLLTIAGTLEEPTSGAGSSPAVTCRSCRAMASWADRVVFMRDGRLVDQTPPRPGTESLLTPGLRT